MIRSLRMYVGMRTARVTSGLDDNKNYRLSFKYPGLERKGYEREENKAMA